MSYTALYRKWRPETFSEVKGQDAIVKTLKNQVATSHTAHAYLFNGTRGTGKTSIAKLFAKSVNCEHPVDGSPCGECASCKAIAEGRSMNVIEIDAASNNGVDNIREIVNEVAYSPTEGKYRVYIIDEVHMLSAGAFNALLKTLEEPPSYVIFILATTEAHKIPITILSRCQRYDFRRISIDTIAGRLTDLMEKEQVNVEERAIRYIAKAADGSMRDALSLLDQCIAFYLGQELTYEKVLETLGAVDTEVFSRLLRQILDKNVTGAIQVIDGMVIEGREMGQFVTDFTWYLRNLLLVQSSDNMEDVLDISADNLALLKEEAEMVDPEILMRYIRIFSELSNQIKYATQKRILIEINVIKLCKPEMEKDYTSLVDRVDSLEKKLEELLNGFEGQWSVYVKDLGSGEQFSINNQSMTSASLIKAFVMAASYENMDRLRVQEGTILKAEPLSDTVLNKLYALTENMVTFSDNESFNEMVRLQTPSMQFNAGARVINRFLRGQGYQETAVLHTLAPSSTEPVGLGGSNTTSVEDCGKLLESIYRGECVSEEASSQMLSFLLMQDTRTKIPGGLTDSITIANKTGENDSNQHDIAIVYGDRTDYVLCVMSENGGTEETAVSNIRMISALTYYALNW